MEWKKRSGLHYLLDCKSQFHHWLIENLWHYIKHGNLSRYFLFPVVISITLTCDKMCQFAQKFFCYFQSFSYFYDGPKVSKIKWSRNTDCYTVHMLFYRPSQLSGFVENFLISLWKKRSNQKSPRKRIPVDIAKYYLYVLMSGWPNFNFSFCSLLSWSHLQRKT